MVSIKSATTETSTLTPETGEPWYEQVKDGGDVRDNACRALPAPSAGEFWGKQLPVKALGCERM